MLDRRLAPLHRNSQAIPAVNGILEDVFALITPLEESEQSDRTDQQHQQQIKLALKNLHNHADAVAANRSTAHEQLDHHDRAPHAM